MCLNQHGYYTKTQVFEIKKSFRRRKELDTEKAAAAIFPLGVLSPPGRLTSEFGMGSGVSAGPSQPPMKKESYLQ